MGAPTARQGGFQGTMFGRKPSHARHAHRLACSSASTAVAPAPASASPSSPGAHSAPSPPTHLTPAEALKLKYMSLARRQTSSPGGFAARAQPHGASSPSAAASPAPMQPPHGDQPQHALPPAPVRATPLPSVREDIRIRFKLQQYMSAHTLVKKPKPAAAAAAAAAGDGASDAPQHHKQHQQHARQQQQEQRKQQQRMFPAPAAGAGGQQRTTAYGDGVGSDRGGREPGMRWLEHPVARQVLAPPDTARESGNGSSFEDDASSSSTSTSTSASSRPAAQQGARASRALPMVAAGGPAMPVPGGMVFGSGAAPVLPEEMPVSPPPSASTAASSSSSPQPRLAPAARRSADSAFVTNLLTKASESHSSLLSSVAAALQSCASSLTLGYNGSGSATTAASAGTSSPVTAVAATQQTRQQGRGAAAAREGREQGDGGSGDRTERGEDAEEDAREDSMAGRLARLRARRAAAGPSKDAAAPRRPVPRPTLKRRAPSRLAAPVPPPVPQLAARRTAAPRTVDAARLPSMAAAPWRRRRVPREMQRRLLRLRNPDYDLDARRGYVARLDLLVREQRQRAAGMVARAGAASAGAAVLAQQQRPDQQQQPWQRRDWSGEGGVGGEGLDESRGRYHPGVEAVNDMLQRLLGQAAAGAGQVAGPSWQGLPAKAFHGRRGEQLVSLSPAQITTQVGLWLDIAGHEYTCKFLEREPTLLTRHPGWLLLGLEMFNQVLGLSPGECLQFALKNTALLSVSSEQLTAAVEQVSQLFDVSRDEARRLVIKNTTLATSPSPLPERLEALATLLPVSRPRLLAILKQRPSLLTQSAVRHALAIAELANATETPLFNAAMLAAGQPGLLHLSPDVLRARWARLRELAALHPAWRQQLDDAPPAAVARCLAASDSAIERLAACHAAGLAGTPSATRGLKLHRILSMTDAGFEALLATQGGAKARKVQQGSEGSRSAATEAPAALGGPAAAAAASSSAVWAGAGAVPVGRHQSVPHLPALGQAPEAGPGMWSEAEGVHTGMMAVCGMDLGQGPPASRGWEAVQQQPQSAFAR